MQFDQAGLITAQVQWYWCQPEAKYFHLPNSFCSGSWDKISYSHVGIGETADPTTWRDGSFPIPVTGTDKVCGDPTWFTEGCPSDAPPLPRNTSGLSTCCGPGGLVLGGHSVITSAYQGRGVLVLGGSSVIPVLCQPYYLTHLGTATATNSAHLGTWVNEFHSTSMIQFIETPNDVDALQLFNASPIPCGTATATTCTLIVVAGGPVQTVSLTLVSYNTVTNTGVWSVPAGTRNYGGTTFSITVTP
jgi:hypothetical protein